MLLALKKYLEAHPLLNKKMTLLVRQMPINQYGLPIEIYTFTFPIFLVIYYHITMFGFTIPPTPAHPESI